MKGNADDPDKDSNSNFIITYACEPGAGTSAFNEFFENISKCFEDNLKNKKVLVLPDAILPINDYESKAELRCVTPRHLLLPTSEAQFIRLRPLYLTENK